MIVRSPGDQFIFDMSRDFLDIVRHKKKKHMFVAALIHKDDESKYEIEQHLVSRHDSTEFDALQTFLQQSYFVQLMDIEDLLLWTKPMLVFALMFFYPSDGLTDILTTDEVTMLHYTLCARCNTSPHYPSTTRARIHEIYDMIRYIQHHVIVENFTSVDAFQEQLDLDKFYLPQNRPYFFYIYSQRKGRWFMCRYKKKAGLIPEPPKVAYRMDLLKL